MYQLDENFLASLGLEDMPETEKKEFLIHVREELELRVGNELAKVLSDAQMDQFEQIIRQADEDRAMQWLRQNCPNYKEVIADQMEKLKQDIAANRQKILGQAEAA